MTHTSSIQRKTRLARPRSSRIVMLLTTIALACAAFVTAQAQNPNQGRFRVVPLTPSGTYVMDAAEKQAMLDKGIDQRLSINAPEQTAACSPEVSIGPGTSPAGYLPLSGFGVAPIAGVTDDSVTNFAGVTPFLYGGKSWTSFGMSSNGYVIVGGQTAPEDNTFVNQLFPNPTRPNNVLAPFWTDLNPQAGGVLRAAFLTDGTNTWIVCDWENVRYFSTTQTVSFQIWIGIQGDPTPVEDITYPYGPIQGMGNGNALTVGAENEFGDRGDNEYFSFFGGGSTGTLPMNGTELRVTTSTPASCQNITAETAIGLTTDNRLVTFNTNAPGTILRNVAITGLLGGEIVLAIDFRPASGGNQLFGYTNYGRVVTLDQASGAATLVGVPARALTGNSYGFDFNPTVDRIRIVNDQNQNSRINPNNGATTDSPVNDGDLAYAMGDPFFGNDPTITGAAYTNNFSGATTTTLYDIDSGFDILVTQNPPNTGVLNTVGSLGVNTNDLVGFDISSNTGIAYATLSNAFNVSSLYTINLTNGNATLVGQVGSTATALRGFAIGFAPPANIFGVTLNNRLISFNAARPNITLSDVPITGLAFGEAVLGIDYRPADSLLYGFTGYNRIVTIDVKSGAATVIGTPNTLQGTEYGFDFNPTVDRIRIVNDQDQNARAHPDTGATVATDGNLAYAMGDPNFGQNPSITGVAYTNNVAGATSTTLYDIDSNLNILTTQNPPNTGTLNTVGPLGVDTGDAVGFDISGANGIAYASLTNASSISSLYVINLTTGAATLIGSIGSSPTTLRGIAISPFVAKDIIGLTSGNRLVRFSQINPNAISTPVPITGLLGGEAVITIDSRPLDGALYGLTNYGRVVTINPNTGAATFVGTPGGLSGSSYGFDFNPVPDRIRVVNNNDQNFRVNPNDGTLTAMDGPLAYAMGDPNFGQNPNIVGAAYTNNFAGATTTTLYDIDSNLDVLVTQNPPNSGTLNTVGPLGFNTSDVVGFDIDRETGGAFAALQPAIGGFSSLYSINLSTGQATLIGQIGGTEAILGIAIVIQ